MKTFVTALVLSALVLTTIGCANCRWPWQRTVTASMPPATSPCGPGGPAASVPGEACGAPVLAAPAGATTVLPGGPAATAPVLPAPQTYTPTLGPGTTYAAPSQ